MKVNVNEVAKVRAGTHCKFCGRPIVAGEQFFSADGGALGSVIYGHTDCAVRLSYYHKNTDTAHIGTYSGFRWGAEFETMDRTTKEERLQLKAWYDLDCTSDASVSEEFKSPIINGIHGVKKYLEGIEKIIDIANGDDCGTHLNFSLSAWDDENLRENGVLDIFEILAPRIKNHFSKDDRVSVFGRDFCYYAKYTDVRFLHDGNEGIYDFIGVHHHRIEIRLARYRNVTQYSHLIMLAKVWALEIQKFIDGTQTARESALKMEKAMQKHINGKATYQRPERNK